MHAVHPFFLSPEIVLHQAFDHEIMATRGLCGLLQSAPKRMTALDVFYVGLTPRRRLGDNC